MDIIEDERMMIGRSSRNGSFRKGSLSFRLNNNMSKREREEGDDDKNSVIQLGNIDTQRLLLLGGERDHHKHQQRYLPTNSLSLRQMKALTALCDTILPSINILTSSSTTNNHNDVVPLSTFYSTSASMAGVHQLVLLYLQTHFFFFFTF